jgi:hypothetical protein
MAGTVQWRLSALSRGSPLQLSSGGCRWRGGAEGPLSNPGISSERGVQHVLRGGGGIGGLYLHHIIPRHSYYNQGEGVDLLIENRNG